MRYRLRRITQHDFSERSRHAERTGVRVRDTPPCLAKAHASSVNRYWGYMQRLVIPAATRKELSPELHHE